MASPARHRETAGKIQLPAVQRWGAEHPALDGEPISNAHRALGVRVTRFRGDMSATEASALLGISTIQLKKLELGKFNPTLTQLQRMSEVMGEPIHELIKTVKMQSPTKL